MRHPVSMFRFCSTVPVGNSSRCELLREDWLPLQIEPAHVHPPRRVIISAIVLTLALGLSTHSSPYSVQAASPPINQAENSSDQSAQDPNSLLRFDKSRRTDEKLIPLLESPPPAYRRLIDKGKVIFIVNDALLERFNRNALTIFWFHTKHRANFTIQGAAPEGDDSARIQLKNRFQRTNFSISHCVILPSWFKIDDGWKSKLLCHEMDHVALTTDPRVEKLFRKIAWKNGEISSVIPKIRVRDRTVLREIVQRTFDARLAGFETFLQNVYDELDRVSVDGRRDIDERTSFFSTIFEAESIQRLGLDIDDELMEFVRSDPYSDLEGHYDLLERTIAQ